MLAVFPVVLSFTERIQIAKRTNDPGRERAVFCKSSVDSGGGLSAVAHLLNFAGATEPRNRLSWNSALDQNRDPQMIAASFNGNPPLIVGLPERAPGIAPSATAQTIDVNVGNNFFSPSVIHVSQGDTVRWVWTGNGHTVTSGSCCDADGDYCSPSNFNCEASQASFTGSVYSHTFNTVGSFPYFCNIHLGAMTGTVIVDAVTATPTPTPTPTPSPSPSPSPQWLPVVLTDQQIDQLKSWTLGGRTSIYVRPKFPDAGYRIVSWGQPVQTGNTFNVNANVEKFTGASTQAVVTTAQIYDLGPLPNGTYTFNFNTSGSLAKSVQFTVSNTTPLPNPIDDQRQFVRQQYLDFLNREPDGPGWDFWTDNITRCSDPARRPALQTEPECISRQRETTSAAFFISPEFQNTGYFVLRVYRGSLNRFSYFGGSVPADNSKDEFTRDHAAVSAGIVVNNQLDSSVINGNKQAFVNQFVTRAEFLAIYGGLTNNQYVDKLFQTTGVTPTVAERNALIDGLTSGTETKASVLFKIVDGTNTVAGGALEFQTRYGQLFYQQQFNPAFVQMEYFGYMKRDPDDAGYAFWLGKLNQYPSFVEAEMVLAFISSPEYRARFGQP
jgi:plastocyanin